MTASTPVQRVAEILAGAGYRAVSVPLEIAGLKFEFPAAFIGTNPSPDLILIADTAFEDELRILKKIEGVARAMDVVRSKRPLTAVLAGPRPSSATLDSISRVCRVLPIGVTSGEDSDATLRNWLAILMPLNLPEPSASIADPLTEIAKQLDGLQPAVAGLVDLAPQGADAVEARLHDIIAEAFPNENSAGDA